MNEISAAPIALDLADPECRMGHAWRHVTHVHIDDGAFVSLEGFQVGIVGLGLFPVRESQDIIACTRCKLVSIARRPSA